MVFTSNWAYVQSKQERLINELFDFLAKQSSLPILDCEFCGAVMHKLPGTFRAPSGRSVTINLGICLLCRPDFLKPR